MSRQEQQFQSSREVDRVSQQNRIRMLRRLRRVYEDLRIQSLQGAAQIELGLASRPTAIQINAANLFRHLPDHDQLEQPLSPGTSIIQVYEQARGELLILGEPGSGKSTLLLELADNLVQRAEQDDVYPLPILLPLSSWAINRPPLQDWLGEQLALVYDIPRSISQQWIQAEMVIPLLDGLDEMETSARVACIAAINIYHREHLQPLVVCSRTNQYETATTHERLSLHTAVVVQPLSLGLVDAYLLRAGESQATLRSALRRNPTLAELATNPLMLQVLMITYQGTSVRGLSQEEVPLRQQIFESYVQRMISHRGDVRRYPLQITTAWCSWLARQMRMHAQTIFFLEDLQPDWLPKRLSSFYLWAAGLVVGLAVGLIIGLVVGLVVGLVTALVVMLVTMLIIVLYIGWNKRIRPIQVLTWSWKRVRSKLAAVLCSAFFAGLVTGLVADPRFGLVVELIFGLVTALVVGLITMLAAGFSAERLTERFRQVPNQGIRRSARYGILFGLTTFLFVELAIGLVSEWFNTLALGLRFGAVVGLLSGLTVGIIFGLGAVIQHYILRFWLWRTHSFPWQAVSFLEDASARILLQRVGGGYIFIHRLLLEYFADLDVGSASVPTISSPTVGDLQEANRSSDKYAPFSERNNPYGYGNPASPSAFFGRQEELEQIVQAVTKPIKQDIFVIGERRSGKTSLLYQLSKRLYSPFIPIYINLAEGKPQTEALLDHIVRGITQALIDRNIIEPIWETHHFISPDFTGKISEIVQAAQKKILSINLILLLDEADFLLEVEVQEEYNSTLFTGRSYQKDERIQRVLRAAFQSPKVGSQLRVVVAGTTALSTHVLQHSSPFFNHFRFVPLKLLSNEETYSLIVAPARNIGFSYLPHSIERITFLSGCYPYYCQALCYESFAYALQQKFTVIDDAAVDAAEKKIREDLFEGYRSSFWQRTTSKERSVLVALARGKDHRAFSRMQIERLLDWQLLIQRGEGYDFSAGLFQQWTMMAIEKG